jgi:opacity protein-like surface antigen
MRICCLCLLVAGMLSTTSAVAQSKRVTHQQLVWLNYNNMLQFGPKWTLTTELHERRFIYPGRHHQFVIRNSLRYNLGENWAASAGFTYFLQSPNDPRDIETLVVPELRPHVQLNYNQPLGRFNITHRYRAEKRFFRNVANGALTPGYNSNYRFRYRFGIEYRVAEINDQPLKLKLNDEVMVNAGEEVIYNRFDQNRLYVGVNYAVSKSIEVEAGYINWYQQRKSGNEFYNRHIINFVVNHRIRLGKKSED